MPTTTNYIWDEDNLLAEADGSNTIQTVYTNEPQQYGNLVSTRLPVGGTPTTVHHFDALGSTRQLTNAVGAVTDTMIYDAWGNVVSRTGSTPTAHQWIGELGYYLDAETAKVHVRERVYEPLIARWTALDPAFPIGPLDQYVYCANRPVDAFDPSGALCALECVCCALGGMVANVQKINKKSGIPIDAGQPVIFGHSFDYTASTEYIPGPAGDCRLEWLECSNVWPKEYIAAGQKQGINVQPFQWVDAFKLLGAAAEWTKYLKGEKPCPGKLPVGPINDTPAITYKFVDPNTGRLNFKTHEFRVMNFAFRLSSAPGGRCTARSHTLFYHQVLWDFGPDRIPFPFGYWLFQPGLYPIPGGCRVPPP
jgi:RHS repeat-associated protein